MKKIILLCLVAFSIIGAEAQTKRGKKHSKKPTKEAIAKAKFLKVENQKKLMRDSLIIGMKMEDSLRLAGDSIADIQKDSLSLAYRENGLKNIDSLKNVRYGLIIKNRDEADKTDKTMMDISKAAKLTEYQTKQVKYINQTYSDKAKAIVQGEDPKTKQQELAVLNEERRSKIRVIVGKKHERKLEDERKELIKKNGADEANAWIDIAESVAKNK
jgi:hypothetical protein